MAGEDPRLPLRDDGVSSDVPGDLTADPTPPRPETKVALRRRLQAERLALPDRDACALALESELERWLAGRNDDVVGAYWPIRGEFDPLPVLTRWLAAGREGAGRRRQVGLPVVDPDEKRMWFHEWTPGAAMAPDAYGIPEPVGTPRLTPTLLLVPCVGFGPGGLRLGYGGGFYDRMLGALDPMPATLGLAFATAFVPSLEPGPYDIPLDAVLTDEGLSATRP